MSCLELSRLLAGQPLAALPPAQRAAADQHLSQCPTCRAFLQSIDGINRMSVPQSLFTPEEIAPVRPMPSRVWFIAVALLVPSVLALAGILWKGAFGWNVLPAETAGAYVVLAVIGLATLTLGFYRQFKPGARDTVDGRAATAILLVGFVAFSAVEFGWHPHSGSVLASAWSCFRFGAAISLVAAIALAAWARRGFALEPRSASFWTGSLASMAGMIALAAHCPTLELSHVLLGHATVILATTLVVAALARPLFDAR